MGLIRGIAEAVIEKAKLEVKDYLIKFMEEEKNSKEQSDPEKENSIEKPVQKQEIEKKEIEPEPKKTEEKKEIFPLLEAEFVKISYKVKPDNISIPKELAEIVNMLPMEEFACYVKLLIFVQEQKKNFGYLGNALKKKIGLDYLSAEQFEILIQNLQSYGVIDVDQVSDNQKTFILYIPFDEESMIKAEISKSEKPQKKKTSPKSAEKLTDTEKHSSEDDRKPDDLPGKAVTGMENDELYKSYRTFVSLEIDKAKMRVGRSNFDKIYMEAVKYIDKKYGFKVLSDSEKFKEHLTNYYISAFDIKTFEEWKKSKS